MLSNTQSLVIYLAVMFVPAFLLYQVRKKNTESIKFKLVLVFSVLLPAIVYGFREGGGTDFETYRQYYYFYDIPYVLKGYMEIGYNFLILISKLMGMDYHGVNLFCGLVISICPLKALLIIEQKENLWIGYYLNIVTLYFFGFNGVRSALAIELLLVALAYYMKQKYAQSVISFMFAVVFHTTAIIAILFVAIKWFIYFGKRVRQKKTYVFLVIVFLTSFIIVTRNIMLNVVHGLGYYTNFGQAPTRLEELTFLFYMLPEILLIANFVRSSDYMKIFQLYFIFLTAIPFQILGIWIRYVDRIALYSMSTRILIYPNILDRLEGEKKRSFKLLSIGWFLFYFFVMFCVLNAHDIFPYYSMW